MARSLDELDYYTLLGVPSEATVDAIKSAFRAFALRFHPDRFAGDAERVAEASRVYRRATEAYRVLSHPEQRRSYDELLRQGQLRMQPQSSRRSLRPSMAVGQTLSSVPPPARVRPFLARAEQALAAGDPKQARLNFQIALQHDPGNEALRQKLAHVEALLKPR
jgi:curved DNA-binding protein CbpA